MASIKPHTTLFDVYGLDKPTEIGGKLVHMGQVKLGNEPLTTSLFGDKYLFFRHQIFTDDLKLKPEWKQYTPLYSLDGKCPYQKML